jgi:hypothetical protein
MAIARTQYNDFTGSIAADDDDNSPFSEWLSDQARLSEEESVAGFSIYRSSPYMPDEDSFGIAICVRSGSGQMRWRDSGMRLDLTTLFRMFKRFHIIASWGEIDLPEPP